MPRGIIKMKKFKKFLAVFLVIGLLIGIGLFLFIKRKKELASVSPPLKRPIAVNVVKVNRGHLEVKSHYIGKLVPVKKALISTRLSGYIMKIYRDEGEFFRKGDVLVEIDSTELRSRLRSLEAQLWAAKKELLVRKKIFLRNKKLLKYQAISKEAYELSSVSFETAKAKVKSLEEQIKQIKSQLSYALIKAPFSGVVLKKLKEQGDLTMPGVPILEVEDPSEGYKVLVQVPQEILPSLKKGQKVYLTFGNKKETSKIFKIYPAMEDNSLGTVEIRLRKRPFGLPSNSLLGVDIVLKDAEGFVLPVDALVDGKTQGVFVVEKDRLKFIPVKVLGKSEGSLVCDGNLKIGEFVVVGDPGFLMRLYSGERVYPVANILEKAKR